MYEAYYGLREKPFSIQPDPDYLYMGKRHRLAYAMLECGLQNRAGFTVICGEIGCGKTTLVRRLLNSVGADVTIGLVYNTHRETADLLEWVMLAFGQAYKDMSPIGRYEAFQQFLLAEYAAGRRVVLIVDEAQNLSPDALESLRMLSNINADKDQLLQMVLVGQPQLRDLLNHASLRQFAQRVAVDYFVPPLDAQDVALYVQHRLSVAGCREELFSPKALVRIFNATHGIPRSINILCDTSLLYAFAAESRTVELGTIDEVLADRREYGVLVRDA